MLDISIIERLPEGREPLRLPLLPFLLAPVWVLVVPDSFLLGLADLSQLLVVVALALHSFPDGLEVVISLVLQFLLAIESFIETVLLAIVFKVRLHFLHDNLRHLSPDVLQHTADLLFPLTLHESDVRCIFEAQSLGHDSTEKFGVAEQVASDFLVVFGRESSVLFQLDPVVPEDVGHRHGVVGDYFLEF